MRWTQPVLLALILVIATLVVACESQKGNINGRIVANRHGELIPIADGQIRIWPTTPGPKPQKFDAEAVQNLKGIATTRANGQFEITSLSSASTFSEYDLIKGWTYSIEVEVPGYYIASAQFDYTGGNQYLEVEIEEKVVDVLDTSGVVQQDEKRLIHGAVRKQ